MLSPEEQLKNIKVKALDQNDQEVIWQRVMLKREQPVLESANLFMSLNLLSMKQLISGALALVVLFCGVGVVSAANQAGPGDALFGLDLALEKAQLSLTAQEKIEAVKLKLAEERLDEIAEVTTDLSAEADVEASEDSNHGQGKALGRGKHNDEDLAIGLIQIEALLDDLDEDDADNIRDALNTLLAFLDDDTTIQIETDDGEVEIKREDGQIIIDLQTDEDEDTDNDDSDTDTDEDNDDGEDDNLGHGNDADHDDEDNPGQGGGNHGANLNLDGDITIDLDDEDEDEVDDNSGSDSDEDEDDNSGSDDEVENEDEDEDDDDNSGSGSDDQNDDDEDEDEDNE